MPRFLWTMLPPEVRAAVETRMNAHVVDATSADHTNAAVAEVLEFDNRNRVFIKGVQVPAGETTYQAAQLAKEARVLPHLPHGTAPTLSFLIDVHGFRLIATEHVTGHRANLEPDSPDVEIVAHELATIAVNPRMTRSPIRTMPNLAHCLAAEEPWRRLAALNPDGLDRWTFDRLRDFADREPDTVAMCEGNALLHNALSRSDLVVYRHRWLCVLDWRHAQLGPPWVDLATFAALLIENGHPPEQAEAVVKRNPVWAAADPAAITAHAVQTYGSWELRRILRPHPVNTMRAAAWRVWAAFRWHGFRAKHRL